MVGFNLLRGKNFDDKLGRACWFAFQHTCHPILFFFRGIFLLEGGFFFFSFPSTRKLYTRITSGSEAGFSKLFLLGTGLCLTSRGRVCDSGGSSLGTVIASSSFCRYFGGRCFYFICGQDWFVLICLPPSCLIWVNRQGHIHFARYLSRRADGFFFFFFSRFWCFFGRILCLFFLILSNVLLTSELKKRLEAGGWLIDRLVDGSHRRWVGL